MSKETCKFTGFPGYRSSWWSISKEPCKFTEFLDRGHAGGMSKEPCKDLFMLKLFLIIFVCNILSLDIRGLTYQINKKFVFNGPNNVSFLQITYIKVIYPRN